MFLGFTDTNMRNNHKLISHTDLSFFWGVGWRGGGGGRGYEGGGGEFTPDPICLEYIQNSNSNPFCKVGEIQL